MNVNFGDIKKVSARGIIVTAPGEKTDFVSRFFAPQVGIDEDPVTGSAHTTLVPIWAKKHGKTVLSAAQLSKRGGTLSCELVGDRVHLLGSAVTFLAGEFEI
jgi:predicted PhzF superfamily epimerase YddE/YHI9